MMPPLLLPGHSGSIRKCPGKILCLQFLAPFFGTSEDEKGHAQAVVPGFNGSLFYTETARVGSAAWLGGQWGSG